MARSQVPAVLLAMLFGMVLVHQISNAFVGSRPQAVSRSVAMRARGGDDDVDRSQTIRSENPDDRIILKVLSPEGDGIDVSASEVILPSASGQLGVLANHAPMMSALDTGVLRYKMDNKWVPLVVMGGFASIDSNTLNVLVNDWETVDEIDMNQAKTEMEQATQALEKAESKKDKLDATTLVKKASARLQAAMFKSGKK
eukprot:TRINITY_DN176_c0_g3_i2.p1 TRINITY_DN176_c0_g3~~TRINITY_DN176_c0_g3_i2.p1  ORF type:complete len:199 (-),score=48.46 TRINITY_DN176_c0_g3_i2:406-1002(-)